MAASPAPAATALSDAALIEAGQIALGIEAAAIQSLIQTLGAPFAQACRLLSACQGRVVVTGIGKSGHIAGKIAATLSSTGTPAYFLHPAEAMHGDIGLVTRADVVVALSNSGESAEILALVPTFKRLGIALISLTGNPASTLARVADLHLNVAVPAEACPLNLAPTASTTAALAIGDALAVVVLRLKGFSEQDFARSHPGGTLGRRLLLHVDDIMHQGEQIPRVGPDDTVAQGLLEISKKGLGMTCVCNPDGLLLGVFTDGDLRRALDFKLDIHSTTLRTVMTALCRTIGPRALAVDAVVTLQEHRITALAVVNEHGHLVGALNVHDLLRAGVM
jgi:arabinose-5-phosphate isomerase